MAHKIPTLEHYNSDSGKGIPILVRYTDKPSSISEESILLQSLIRPINIRRLYIDKEHAVEARAVIFNILKDDEGDE